LTYAQLQADYQQLEPEADIGMTSAQI